LIKKISLPFPPPSGVGVGVRVGVDVGANVGNEVCVGAAVSVNASTTSAVEVNWTGREPQPAIRKQMDKLTMDRWSMEVS